MKKPNALRPGDKVAIVSLSSGLIGEKSVEYQIEIGMKRIKSFGLIPVFMPNALRGIQYLKETPEARAEDLKEAFYNDSIKGIICAIGGDDTYRLFPSLMEDKTFLRTVRATPKLFSGFSDTTINHFMFYKLGMVSYYGPNFLCDLAEPALKMLPYTKSEFQRYLEGNDYRKILSSEFWYEERTDFSRDAAGKERIKHKETRGYEIIQGSGIRSGYLLGGCLESIYDMITGLRYKDQKMIIDTYSIFPAQEEWRNKILFIETCEEKPSPLLFEKELRELETKGVFDEINGMIVGKPQNETYYVEYKEVLKRVLGGRSVPIMYNVNFGHAEPRGIIPYGIMVEVDFTNAKIQLMEPLMKYSY